MIAPSADLGFPKSARLLKSRDFKFPTYQRFRSDLFSFIVCPRGSGRLGVSISKKVLKRSIARNRVRRLLRETFRLQREQMSTLDIHVIGLPSLTKAWATLKRADVQDQFSQWLDQKKSA